MGEKTIRACLQLMCLWNLSKETPSQVKQCNLGPRASFIAMHVFFIYVWV